MAKSSRSANGRAKAKPSPRERSAIMSKVATKRWDDVRNTEADIREYFLNTPLDTCLETYALMRKHYDVASKILDDRVKAANKEVCIVCGKEFTKDIPWYNRDPVKDPATGIVTNVFTCCQAHLIASKDRQGAGLRKY